MKLLSFRTIHWPLYIQKQICTKNITHWTTINLSDKENKDLAHWKQQSTHKTAQNTKAVKQSQKFSHSHSSLQVKSISGTLMLAFLCVSLSVTPLTLFFQDFWYFWRGDTLEFHWSPFILAHDHSPLHPLSSWNLTPHSTTGASSSTSASPRPRVPLRASTTSTFGVLLGRPPPHVGLSTPQRGPSPLPHFFGEMSPQVALSPGDTSLENAPRCPEAEDSPRNPRRRRNGREREGEREKSWERVRERNSPHKKPHHHHFEDQI